MPTPPASYRARLPLPRGRTLAGGAALAGVLLLALAVAGGVSVPTAEPEPERSRRTGPLTAVQPELHQALLGDEDLPAAPPGSSPAPATDPVGSPPVATTGAADPSSPAPEDGRLPDLCRALFEDPASLPAGWGADPQETSSQRTRPPGGGTLEQVLARFADGQAAQAFAQLREAAAGCDQFAAALADGTVVRVLLEELRWDREESARTEEAYAVQITVEHAQRPLHGWLALDRVGPVVSVLRQLAPPGSAAGDPPGVRDAALGKVRSLLRTLGERARAGWPDRPPDRGDPRGDGAQ